MAASAVIPKERLSAYERWEMDSFDAPGKRGIALTTVDQVEKIHQQAYQEGRKAGYEDGRKRAVAEAAKIGELAKAFAGETAGLDQQLAQQTLDLALEVARQMLHTALAVRPELTLPLIQEAIRSLPMASEERYVRLHPDDAALARQYLEDTLTASGWKIIEDPAIARGGCRASNSQGGVDATMDTRWRRIAGSFGSEQGWLDLPQEDGGA